MNIIEQKSISKPRSFRLRSVDIERLDNSLRKVNSENDTVPFNKTDLLRGLIMIAHKSSAKKLLDAIRSSL